MGDWLYLIIAIVVLAVGVIVGFVVMGRRRQYAADHAPTREVTTTAPEAATTVDAPVESIRVVVREVPTTHWGAGDVTIAERRGAPDPRTSDGG